MVGGSDLAPGSATVSLNDLRELLSSMGLISHMSFPLLPLRNTAEDHHHKMQYGLQYDSAIL